MKGLRDEEQPMATLPNHSATVRLWWFTLVLLALNVIATVVAVALNLPAQFGGVGTDAGDEFLSRGTAISAPLLPVVLMVLIVLRATAKPVELDRGRLGVCSGGGRRDRRDRRDGCRIDGGHLTHGTHHLGRRLADRCGRTHRAGDLSRGANPKVGGHTRPLAWLG